MLQEAEKTSPATAPASQPAGTPVEEDPLVKEWKPKFDALRERYAEARAHRAHENESIIAFGQRIVDMKKNVTALTVEIAGLPATYQRLQRSAEASGVNASAFDEGIDASDQP